MTKRLFDIVASLPGLLFLILVTPFITLAIIIEDGFPIFVKLERVSEGKKVNIYKFRSMINNAENMKETLKHMNERDDRPFFKIKKDPRITKVGKILRRLRIDEFPQLINVLKGDISLVGPRPHEEEEIKKYPKKYKGIPLAKAGLTGLSQVNGASGLPYDKELDLDLYYIKNKNILMDIKILFKTAWIFFSDPTGV